MVIREKTQKLEWAIFCVLCFGRMGLGAFTFTTYPSQNGNQYTCDGSSAVLIWDYTTDETLKSIDWYKQPGNVLIGNFGLGSFTASAAYTGRVSQYQPGTYKAAIQIANFALSDGGEYSCFVKANTDHSQNGKMFYGDTPVGNVVIDYSDRRNSTCFPPNGTSGVTITWSGSETKTGTDGVYGINTCKGGHVKCSMTGGSASCGNKSYSMEEDIPECYLWILISLIFILLDVTFTTVIKVLMKKKLLNLCFGLWWILMIALPVIGVGITLVVTFVPCFDCCGCAAGYGFLIGILSSGPSIVVKILFLCKCCGTDSKGEKSANNSKQKE